MKLTHDFVFKNKKREKTSTEKVYLKNQILFLEKKLEQLVKNKKLLSKHQEQIALQWKLRAFLENRKKIKAIVEHIKLKRAVEEQNIFLKIY